MTQSPTTLPRLRSYLETPISIQSLVVIRITFGLILAWDWWRYVKYDRINRYYVDPDFNFPFFDFVQILPEPWIHILWGGVGLFGLLVALGAFYRVSIIALTGIFAYFFLLDRTQYLNHNYMVILFGVLMIFMPAHRAFLIDAWLWPKLRSAVIPRWPVTALKLQLEIILIYAGIVKITDDWLRGEPLRTWLTGREDEVFFGALFQYDISFILASWGVIVLHVVGAPLLLWHRTRLAVFAIYAFFHWSNAQLFNIGIFPWITLALSTIFFAPDWPQHLLRAGLGRFETLPEQAKLPKATFRLAPLGLAVLAVWFAVQIAVPQRQAFFNNLVGWSGDGHRFSWRMRIYDRDSKGVFRIVSPVWEETWEVDPYQVMSFRQARNVLGRPDIIYDFAHMLKDAWAEQGYPDVAVHADVRKSLNGCAMQQFTDPEQDLTSIKWEWVRPNPWILPNQLRAPKGQMPDAFPFLPLQGHRLAETH
ncbi:HTTM domain-containing protein [uncultured Tateyamaria sp.]|uniref:HTTM domain-containing protein n=1 Tax=uncultured Tateyamaria sp. TaxID=455651 RepID=UPI002621E9CE|nr:HTTM domain-containing protein [uncultured Tateyamaria sp.]